MQANCIIFPSPRNFHLNSITDKILLIPKDTSQMYRYYHDLSSSQLPSNDFENFLKQSNTTTIYNSNNCGQMLDVKKIYNNQNAQTNDNLYQYSLIHRKNIIQSIEEDKYSLSQAYIPCLFIKGTKNKIIIYFHANGQDITSAYQFIKLIRFELKFSVLAMEYRGYSIYKQNTDATGIKKDASTIIEYLLAKKIQTEQIIIFGRSIGCAIALSCVKYKIYAMVLLSPFYSLKKVAEQIYGFCAGFIIEQSFENQQNIRNINNPLLIIHGIQDTIVPYEHSLNLLSKCNTFCRLNLIAGMAHSKFNFKKDFINHFNAFLYNVNNVNNNKY